jgi:hypothetical protein
MLAGILEWLGSLPWTGILFATLGILGLIAMVLLTVAMAERTKIRLAQIHVDLKRDMIQRGMSADEIERVLAAGVPDSEPARDRDRYAKVGPATCDVAVVDEDGDWQRAILLHMRGDSCLVHYVGTDIENNETVRRSRVRFPSSVAFDEAAGYEWPEDYNAREATVERYGEWLPAYVLMHLDQCYVHYVGHDWSENEWVDEGRVRFSNRPTEASGGDIGRPVKVAKPTSHELEV